VDDSEDDSWTPTTQIGDIYKCSYLNDCTKRGIIATHIQRGYEWAFQQGADYIMNVDADLLMVKDFFGLMFKQYSEMGSLNPMLTGYASSTHHQAYGANYLFDQVTYRTIVRSSFSPHHRASRNSHTDWAGNVAWDDHMLGEYNHYTQDSIWRPEESFMYHLQSNDALHLNLKEQGVRFDMDDFNKELLLSVKVYLVKAYDGELESKKLPLAPTPDEISSGETQMCEVSSNYENKGEENIEVNFS